MNKPGNHDRRRYLYLALVLTSVLAGLGSRRYSSALPFFFAQYTGDILYAAFIFWATRSLFLKARLWHISVFTVAFCFSIEFLQLFQPSWLQQIRHTQPFGLILGYGFLWSDLVCYLAGTFLAHSIGYMSERDKNDGNF